MLYIVGCIMRMIGSPMVLCVCVICAKRGFIFRNSLEYKGDFTNFHEKCVMKGLIGDLPRMRWSRPKLDRDNYPTWSHLISSLLMRGPTWILSETFFFFWIVQERLKTLKVRAAPNVYKYEKWENQQNKKHTREMM